MADRHVRPGEGGWRVETLDGPQNDVGDDTQQKAIARAQREVAASGGGIVHVYNQEGKVRESRTVEADDLGEVRNTVREAGEQAKGLADDVADRAKKAFGS